MAPKKELPKLIRALEFICLAQREKGAPYQTHAVLRNNMAIAHDGVLTAGHKIDEDLAACPNTHMLLAALRRCAGALSVTQTDNQTLSVKSGRFRAVIPCQPDAAINIIQPDPAVAPMTNEVRHGLEAVSPIIAENSQRVVLASALLRNNSIIATNSQVIIEYWHGVAMPPKGFLVPKLFINALLKIKKNIVAFGFSESSITIYFDDDSWLKTQLYHDNYPDCDRILNTPANPVGIPEGFFEAIDTVAAFSSDGYVRLRDGKVQSAYEDKSGAVHDVEGLLAKITINIKYIELFTEWVDRADFVAMNDVIYLYGDKVRGAICRMKE